MDLQIGSTIGDYQVVDILGAGGMGKVYKVRNVISDRIEALKVLLPDLTAVPDLADRFLREIKLQASLVHPNIAQLHTAVREGNQLLMVMEFVEGQTLDRLLKDGPLPPVKAADTIAQVLAALEYAHSRGVVHRDIKPGNMMMTPEGVVKLMDFGIAKVAADQKLTMTGTTVGSVYYMSPEQIQGAATLDARADLYSVGVTLYELVTGKRPFDGDSQYAIMAAHLEKTPVPPVAIDPKLPAELNDVILLAVAKNPSERFQSATAFRKALLSVKAMLQPASEPVAAPVPAAPAPAPLQQKAPASSGSKRWLWMTVGGMAAAAAIVCAVEFGPWKATHAAPAPTQVAAQPAAPQPAPADPAPPASAQPEPSAPTSAAVQAPPVKSLPPATPKQTATVSDAHPMPSQPAPQVQTAAPAVPAPAPAPQVAAPPPGPSPAQVAKAHEAISKLEIRAGAIHESLDNMKTSLAAQGLALNARFTQPQGLMDLYLRSAQEALSQSDLHSAIEYGDKAERQIEILEKLLNL